MSLIERTSALYGQNRSRPMGHYEARLERDLGAVRQSIRRMGDAVVVAIRGATRAVLSSDRDLATATILGDMPINRQASALDEQCHLFIARHLPSAGHLRFISSAMRLSKTLERIGDYAETIARAAVNLGGTPPETVVRDIEMLGTHAAQVLEESLASYDAGSVVAARRVRSQIGRYGPVFDRVFTDLVQAGYTGTQRIEDLFSLNAICNRLERILHQAKNICEQTIFAVTGERKEQKAFDCLFVDRDGSGASLYAVAYCRSAYPDAGTFRCAGWSAAEEPDPAFAAYAAARGLAFHRAVPVAFDDIRGHVADFDIVIDLHGSAREQIQKIPFHTTLIRWPLESPDDPASVHGELVRRLADLMSTLRGGEAR